MADSDSTRSAETGSRDGREGSRSVGRAIATTLVVALLAYLVGVGFYSVVPALFWPETDDVAGDPTCVEGLGDLRAELFARAGERVASGGGDRDALRSWLQGWDRRHLALEARCEDRHDSWRLLGRLRQRVQGTLDRFDAHERELARDLDHTLAQGTPQGR